jgi:transposase
MSAFLGELLAGEEAWTAPRLLEALERRFFVTFHPGTVRRKLLEMGYRWKRTRYVPTAEERERFEAALGEGTQPLSTRLYHTLRASRSHATTARLPSG